MLQAYLSLAERGCASQMLASEGWLGREGEGGGGGGGGGVRGLDLGG